MDLFHYTFLALWLLCDCVLSLGENPLKRFEYKYSFKGPYLSQKDGSVPFWQYAGHTIASEESVRIVPSLKSQKGSIWTKAKTNFEWWSVEMIFSVKGRGRVGADGLAFWFTETKGLAGPVFGAPDQWKGLGIFFDSYDNDGKRDNPYIMGMVNDGTIQYDHQNDGNQQQLGGCLRDYRNRPYPVRALIEYYNNVLTVMFHVGATQNPNQYELCFRAENVYLPQNGYFGVSAATGGLADDHDVYRFLTHSLRSPSSEQVDQRITEEEQQKLAQEYEQFQQRLDAQRKEYHEKHPEAKKEEPAEGMEYLEDDEVRELRQIFTGQSQIFDVLRDLHRKMDEIIGRQERTLSLVTQGQVGMPSGSQTGQQQPMMMDSIKRHEVDQVLASQRDIVQLGRDIKAYVTEIHQKSTNILSNQAKQPVGQGSAQPVGYDIHTSLNELKDNMNVMKRDLSAASQRLQGTGATGKPCDLNIKCLSTTVFIIFIVVELAILIGYWIYRDNKEAHAKKFY